MPPTQWTFLYKEQSDLLIGFLSIWIAVDRGRVTLPMAPSYHHFDLCPGRVVLIMRCSRPYGWFGGPIIHEWDGKEAKTRLRLSATRRKGRVKKLHTVDSDVQWIDDTFARRHQSSIWFHSNLAAGTRNLPVPVCPSHPKSFRIEVPSNDVMRMAGGSKYPLTWTEDVDWFHSNRHGGPRTKCRKCWREGLCW
jgi:hypothetical protein